MDTDVFVSHEWLEDALGTVVVVDVRPRADYERGHLPGAVSVPFEAFRDRRSDAPGMLPDAETVADLLGGAGITPTDTVVAYDGDRGVNAARFVLTASVYGHEGALHMLEGDVRSWNGPLSTAPAAPTPCAYPRPTVGDPLVDRETVENATTGAAVLVDTRTPAEYDEGHLPGAVQVSWEDLLESEMGRLRDREELRALLQRRGITPDSRIVLYCNTARRVSHTYAVLTHLGFEDVGVYEGSLIDWIRNSGPEWDPAALSETVRRRAPEGLEAVRAALGDDADGRFKLLGLYPQKQPGYFMLRMKIPGGVVTAEQARTIGQVTQEFARAPPEHGGEDHNPEFGDRYLDLTARQDVQLHWIQIEDVPAIWDHLEAVGLTTMQACGNSVRNVVACPLAGVHPDGSRDVRAVTQSITERFLEDTEYASLPRKLKVSLTGCRENCARAQINDLAFTPAVRDGRDGFSVWVGGGLSDGPRMASELDAFVTEEQVVEVVEAVADVFIEYGSYMDTAVNRLRFVVERLGPEVVRDELASRVSFDLEPGGESLTRDYRGDHVGVHELADGSRTVGLAVPTGRMAGTDLCRLAELSTEYAAGELRFTPNQNVLVPSVTGPALEALLKEPLLERFSPSPGPFSRGVVSCTGREFCSYGIVETKTRALRWARALDEWADTAGYDLEVVRIHFSGCSASCAQPQIADIGLRGETRRLESGGSIPAADILLGGDLGREAFGEWVTHAEPLEAVPAMVQSLVRHYEMDRREGETVTDWIGRVDRPALQPEVVQ